MRGRLKGTVEEDPLYDVYSKAHSGDLSVLSSPLVSNLSDEEARGEAWTPLHWLGGLGVKEVLDHPKADLIKDKRGRTPVELLAGFLCKRSSTSYYPPYDSYVILHLALELFRGSNKKEAAKYIGHPVLGPFAAHVFKKEV